MAVAAERGRGITGKNASGAQIRIPYSVFADRLALMLYSPSSASKIPYVLHQGALGNWNTFVTAAYELSQVFYAPTDRPGVIAISKGMYLSSVCSEGVPFINSVDVAGTSNTFTGRTRIDAYRKACTIWNIGPSAQAFTRPVVSSVPTLMISNRFDPSCPWRVANEMLHNWSHARQVTDMSLGHLDDWDCIKSMSIGFIDTLNLWSINTSCAQHPAKVQFATAI